MTDRGQLEEVAGPECLGRSVLVLAGQDAPPPWSQCPRLVVNAGASGGTARKRLRDAWQNREALVIELAGEVPDPSQTIASSWWELKPGATLGDEALHHLLTANVVDARDPQRPRFAPRDQALSLGAEISETADVVVDGRLLWCDGGPLQTFRSDDLASPTKAHGTTAADESSGSPPALIPAANLAAGSLAPLTPCRPHAELAPDQQAAVGHMGGGASIVAPAGSGKTRVLTERVRWLVRGLGIAPSAVCLVAYNVRARAEMQHRTAEIDGLEVRTFNSLALAICNGTGPFVRPRRHGRVEVIDERAVRAMLRGIVDEHTPRRRRQAMTDPLAPYLEAFSASRLGLRNPAEVERDYAPDAPGFGAVAPAYATALSERGVVDFDHQIIRAIDVLLTDPAARATARRNCAVLLVDEFQDLTPAHLLMIRLLAGPRCDVFGVGDDDQTIYGYSGASPDWLINYERWFPGAARHLLDVNYRCPADVVEAAVNLLSHNRRRIDKEIEPAPGDGGASAVEDAVEVRDVEDGGAAVVERVEQLLASGAANSDIAVLTRVNSTLLAPQILLAEAGIDAMKPVGPWFLARTGVAAALAWLRLATSGAARLPEQALAIAARRPPRGISARVAEWIAEQRNVGALRRLAQRITDERTAERVDDFADEIERLNKLASRGATTQQLLEAIRDGAGPEASLGASLDSRLDASRRSLDRSAHGDDLQALVSVSPHCSDPAEFESWLSSRLSNGEGAGEEGDSRTARPAWGSGVRLATVHRVKGLEWPHVIVLGATEGLMPHRLASNTPEQLEEERRVFHVALTRCSGSVLVLADGPRSKFINELAWHAPV